jgi:hypothetical protein
MASGLPTVARLQTDRTNSLLRPSLSRTFQASEAPIVFSQPVRISLKIAERIFMKFDTGEFYERLSCQFNFKLSRETLATLLIV